VSATNIAASFLRGPVSVILELSKNLVPHLNLL
jgi:hypothetical protein